MNTLFIILMAIAMVLVLVSMVGGLFVMVKDGEANRQYSNKMMQARVYLQGLALLFFALAVLTS